MGGRYISSFLNRRFLPVWIQFAICICFFIITDIVLGTIADYSWWHIALSFTGWTTIGNSGWFMFVTFVLYILVFVCFELIRFKDIKWNILIFSVASLAFGIILFIFKPSHWWNTLLCFPAGMWFGYFKEEIDGVLRKNRVYWIVAIPLLLIFVALLYINRIVDTFGLLYEVLSIFFALSVIVITMKVKIGNMILSFFGRHVFSIYILQRIPMMIFEGIITNSLSI